MLVYKRGSDVEELARLFEQHGPLAFSVIILGYVSLRLLKTINTSMRETTQSIEELTKAIGDLQVVVVGISSLIRSLTGLFMRYPQIAKQMTLIIKEETDLFAEGYREEGDDTE